MSTLVRFFTATKIIVMPRQNHTTETIINEQGIEMIVAYSADITPAYYDEPGNPSTYVGPSAEIDLKSVELVIRGTGIDITLSLTPRQRQHIIDLLCVDTI